MRLILTQNDDDVSPPEANDIPYTLIYCFEVPLKIVSAKLAHSIWT